MAGSEKKDGREDDRIEFFILSRNMKDFGRRLIAYIQCLLLLIILDDLLGNDFSLIRYF